MTTRYVVTAGGREASVEMSEKGDQAAITVDGQTEKTAGPRAGAALWKGLGNAGLRANGINLFVIKEAEGEGKIICTVPAVMEGAHVVWKVLYRADRNASCFKSLGSRTRIGDALDVAFAKLASEHEMPHKP